ncbi:multidrug transporter MatE [Porphyromonas sp. COT-108 OH1349]|nr:multidrug transporter MatE [Porphyromonas sp. COT-108 OH1349]
MMDKRSEALEHLPVGRLLRQFAVPAVVGTMVNSLYNVVDRMFIGNGVGSLAISGLAVTFPIIIFLQAMGMLIGSGASARVSILLGAKKRETAEELLGNAFLLTLLISLPATLLCLIYLDDLLLAFGASYQTLKYAREYLIIALPGNIFANIAFSYNAVMRAAGYPSKAMTTMLIGAISNIILDPIFIFVFNMGIAGAAWATVISMFISMCFVVTHFLSKSSNIQLRIKNFKLKKRHIIAILSIGMAPFSMQLTGSLITVILNKSLAQYGGDYAVGAYGILSSFAMLILMLCLGVSQGMQPIVGYNYGAELYHRVKEASWRSFGLNMSIGLVGGLLGVLAPSLIVRGFTSDPKLMDLTVYAVRVCTFHFAVVGFQITTTQYFQSIGRAKVSMLLSLTRQIIYLIPLLLLLPPILGLKGIWFSLPISDILAAMTAFFVYLYHYNKRIKPAL